MFDVIKPYFEIAKGNEEMNSKMCQPQIFAKAFQNRNLNEFWNVFYKNSSELNFIRHYFRLGLSHRPEKSGM